MSGIELAGLITSIAASLTITIAAAWNFVKGWRERIVKDALNSEQVKAVDLRMTRIEKRLEDIETTLMRRGFGRHLHAYQTVHREGGR